MRGTLKICCSYEFSPPIPLPFILAAIPNAELLDTENPTPLNAPYDGKESPKSSNNLPNFVTFNRSTSWKPQLSKLGMAQPNWCSFHHLSRVGVIESETNERLSDLLNNQDIVSLPEISFEPPSLLELSWSCCQLGLVWARFLNQHIWPEIRVTGI